MSSRAVASSSMTRTRSAVCERPPSEPIELLACTPALPGRRTVKTEPLPGSLVTVTSPPIMRASLRVMARPRPVPPYCRAVEESAWVNSSNNLACCSGVMPMPVSATAISIQLRPSTIFLTCSLTAPCLVNLQALLNRLSRICRSRMAVDPAQRFQRLFRAEARRIADHHLGQPDDGIERGAQLMAHAGDELRLMLARAAERTRHPR